MKRKIRSYCAALFILLSISLYSMQDAALDLPTEEENKQAQDFLEEVKKLYEGAGNSGFDSLALSIQVSKSRNPGLKMVLETLQVEYIYEAPDTEKVKVIGLLELLEKVIHDSLRGMWKDLTGATIFSEAEGKKLLLKSDEKEKVLNIFDDVGYVGKIIFDKETDLILRLELLTGEVIEPGYSLNKGKLRLGERRVLLRGEDGKDKFIAAYSYSSFLKVNGYYLPTKLSIESNNDLLELLLEYDLINKKKAGPAEADIEVVKALVKDYERRYSKWSAVQKQEAMEKLEETRHKLAAQAIAKKGLKDKDLEIRKKAAEVLGVMKLRDVVSALLKAMKANEKHSDVYLKIIWALGNLGDPKAISPLSKKFWNQSDGGAGVEAAQAKIDALGKIRSRKSVDALLGLLYMAEPLSMVTVALNLRSSLKSLTGKDYGFDRGKWKSWWKKARPKFKLEED